MKTIIVVPTFNEAKNIISLIARIKKYLPKAEMLFVDDNSNDETRLMIKKMQSKLGRIHLIERPRKLGLGPALRVGFQKALELEADIIIQMDADLSHDPKYLPGMLGDIKSADLVIGSRYVKDGGITNWNFFRILLSRLASIYSRLILDLPYKDLTAGFRTWRKEALIQVLDNKPSANGYVCQIEMSFLAHKIGLIIKETPIIFSERVYGQSKMNPKIALEAILKIWQLRFKSGNG